MKVYKGLFKEEQKGDLIILIIKQKAKREPAENNNLHGEKNPW